jgi:hypothetical protein
MVRQTPPNFVKRNAVNQRIKNGLGKPLTEIKKFTKTQLLDLGLQHGLFSKEEYLDSLPEYVHVRKAYLHSLLNPRLQDVMDKYVCFANTVAARGSLIVNMWVGDNLNAYTGADLVTLLTEPTFFKKLVWPTLPSDQATMTSIQDWWMNRSYLFDNLVVQDNVEWTSILIDQMLNSFQRTYLGHFKSHVKTHLASRLGSLFASTYCNGLPKKDVEKIVKVVLTNDLHELVEPFHQQAFQFRQEMGLGDMVLSVDKDMFEEVLDLIDHGHPNDEGVGEEADISNNDDEEEDMVDEDEDEESADKQSKRELIKLWPIHVQALRALWTLRKRQELSWSQLDEEEQRQSRTKFVKTASLLPVFSYSRNHVFIDGRIMAEMIGIVNSQSFKRPKKLSKEMKEKMIKDEAFVIHPCDEDQALSEMLKVENGLPNKRKTIRRKGKRRNKRAARCGKGMKGQSLSKGILTSIKTDGVSCSLYFTMRRKRRHVIDSVVKVQDKLQDVKEIAIAGNDPGDVFAWTYTSRSISVNDYQSSNPTTFWSTPDENQDEIHTKEYTFSSKDYYHRSLIKRTAEETRQETRSNPLLLEALQSISRTGTWKTPDNLMFTEMCESLQRNQSALYRFRVLSKIGAKRNMLRFRRKRSIMDQVATKFVKRVYNTSKGCANAVVIGYGNASTRTARGRACVPKVELKTALRRALDRFSDHKKIPCFLIMVNEFRTTKLCHYCHSDMEPNYKRRPGSGVVQEDRNFRLCSNCGDETGPKLRSRDGNAADNILYKAWLMLRELQLPEAFSKRRNACGSGS